MAALFQDIRYGIRMMAKNASFTFFVVAVPAGGEGEMVLGTSCPI